MPQNNSTAQNSEQTSHIKDGQDFDHEQTEQTAHIKDGGNFHHEQSEQIKLQTTPDFSHRVKDYFNVACTGDLLEEVDTMVLRSKGILSVIADLHIEAHINQINPQQVYWAINSVMRELDDVLEVIEAHHSAVKANQRT